MTMKQNEDEKTYKYVTSKVSNTMTMTTPAQSDSGKVVVDLFDELEQTLDRVAENNPRLSAEQDADGASVRMTDLKALLQVSLAINASLNLDDVLQMVMQQAIELMHAERGLIMLLDDKGELQVKSAYNLCREQMMEEDFRISSSITNQVARTGKSVYTSDALQDAR